MPTRDARPARACTTRDAEPSDPWAADDQHQGATLMLRRIWRASGKPWLQQGHQWRERRRFPQLFGAIETAVEAGLRIEAALRRGDPFCAGRMGHVEARILGEWQLLRGNWSRATLLEAHTNAGIFPLSDGGLESFAATYGQALGAVDLLGFWQSDHQARLVAGLESPPILCPLAALEPFRQRRPWSEALAGRSVLVVHPFAASIEAQYQRHRAALFDDPRVLPPFRLQVLRPPLTHAPRTEGFANWNDALRSLQERVLGLSFDVTLVGCGAYGLPLAAAIRQEGRQAIHLGGALQLLFGIHGRRWDSDPQIQRLSNAYWIRPSPLETPESAASIEGGCYW